MSTPAHEQNRRAWDAMVEMAGHGNIASRSDLEVGARALEAGIWGASRNVAINLPGIEDEAYRKTAADESDALASRAAQKRDEVLAITGPITSNARDAMSPTCERLGSRCTPSATTRPGTS